MILQNGWIFSICEIYWEYRTAGHLLFWKPWPVTGHIATAKKTVSRAHACPRFLAMRSRRVNRCILLCKKVKNENVQGSAIRAVKTDSEFSTRHMVQRRCVQNPSKTSEKMGYFDRVTVSLHILYAGNKRLRAHKICSLQANNKVYLGQIRSEQIVYSRFIKIPLG